MIVDSVTTPAPAIMGSRVLSFCSLSCRDDFFKSGSRAEATPPKISGEEVDCGVAGKGSSISSEDLVPGEITRSQNEVPAGRCFLSRPGMNGTVFAVGLLLSLLGFFGLAMTVRYLVPDTWSNKQASAKTPETNRPRDDGSSGLPAYAETAEEEPDAGETATRILEESLDSENLLLRIIAAETLLHYGESERARREILQAANDPLWTRRHEAAAALVRLGDPKGVEILERDIKSYRRNVRRSAVFALAALGWEPREIRRFLFRMDSALPAAEMFALGRVRRKLVDGSDDRLKSEVQRVLEKILNSRQSASWEKQRAAAALGMMGNPEGKSFLKNNSMGESLPLGVAIAMAGTVHDMAEEALVQALKHSALRLEAAREMVRMGKRADTAELESEMTSSCESSRVTAAAAFVILTKNRETEAH